MMSIPDPAKLANRVFEESCQSLMAHTIRATVNYFRKHHIDVDIRVIADTFSTVLKKTETKTPSILKTRLRQNGIRGRVHADIFVHVNATKNLARVCIAHEIFHLLVELHSWIDGGRRNWPSIPVDKLMEDRCNVFAWELCRLHDVFNRDEVTRAKSIYFPEGFFQSVLNTNLEASDNWPPSMGFDSAHPFWKSN